MERKNDKRLIIGLDQAEIYKYIDINERQVIQHVKLRENFRKRMFTAGKVAK